MAVPARCMSDDAAALAKNDSDVAGHVTVASVRKSIGPRTRVAGNSFMVNRKAMAAPANMLPRTSGMVTFSSTCKRVFPRVLAASSIRGFNWRMPERIDPSVVGRNRTVYAMMSSRSVW